jgi:hypothetical protein
MVDSKGKPRLLFWMLRAYMSELSVDLAVIGAAARLDGKTTEAPQLPLGAKTVRCLQNAQRHRRADRAHRVCDDDLVPQLGQLPADPWGMGSGFQGDVASRHFSKCLPHRFRGRRQFLLQEDLACFIQNAVERPAIS